MTSKIGVFYDCSSTQVEKTLRRTGLTGAEICGPIPKDDWRALSRKVRLMRAISLASEEITSDPPWPFCYDYIFYCGKDDIPCQHEPPCNWKQLPENTDEKWGRMYLAGSLTLDNIGELIRMYRPYAVDLCEVVETDNFRKDRGLVREFIAAVRQAEEDVREDIAREESGKTAPDDDES
jgi:phosphoribosylanthranilate isomerase